MALNCKTPQDVIKLLKERELKYVDLRFTDPKGKWQHLTMTSEFVDDDAFHDGIMFDGSSIARSTMPSSTTSSSFTFGRKSTTYSAPR